MKRNFLALFALVCAIAFSAFTSERIATTGVFFTYTETDPFQETDAELYDEGEVQEPEECQSSGVVCWINVPQDLDFDSDIDKDDLQILLNQMDTDIPKNGSISDDNDEVEHSYEEKQ